MTQTKTKKSNNITKTASKKKTNSSIQPKAVDPQEQLTAIRALLFGEQVATLEQTIQQQNISLNERMNQLEALINKNHKEINQSIKEAKQTFADNLEENRLEHVSQETILEESVNDLDKRFEAFQQATEQDFTETLNNLSNTAKEINQSLAREVKQLTKKIEDASTELGTNKTDRKTLASLLESMASNLNQN